VRAVSPPGAVGDGPLQGKERLEGKGVGKRVECYRSEVFAVLNLLSVVTVLGLK
jgi:hypothetical protein